jgi:stage II sporulation protein D
LYSSSNGGYTEASENVWGNYTAYLRDKADTFENESWPNGDIILSDLDIDTTLKNHGYLQLTDSFERIDIDNITRFESGRVNSIPIIYKDEAGVEYVRYFTMDSARTFLYLPSSMYTVSYDEGTKSYTFSGKGYGHGLGMSQIGAKQRALAGQSCEEILGFYYDGTSIETIAGSSDTGVVVNQPVESTKPLVRLVTQPNGSYTRGDTISLSVAAPNYSGRVEYRVIIYNGTTKVSTQLYNTPATGYYNRSFQPVGSYLNTIKIPVINLTPAAYNITVLVRKAGTNVAYDSYVKTNTFNVTESSNVVPSRGGTTGLSNIPKLTMSVTPNKEYIPEDTISFNVTSPNYGGKVEYRVILYNGTTKKTSELWNTPATGYYYKGWQPSGNYNFNIHWLVKNMAPGAYSMTVLVRRAGTTVPYDSYVKTDAFWVKN